MPHDITLYGFSGSTYVRTIRMILAGKAAEYRQVPVNVLAGEPRQPEHLARHPFGKVPVLDFDGFRMVETSAIAPYLDEVLPGPSYTPADAKARARMRMAIGIYDSYGYGALVAVAGYHLFPDFVGNPSVASHQAKLEESKKVLQYLFGHSQANFLAGDAVSIADFYLAPTLAYVSLTPDAGTLLSVPGVQPWWERIQKLPMFAATAT
jgi:glutathione S-transferase